MLYAQGPRFPLPNQTDQRVLNSVRDSLSRYPEVEQRVRAVAGAYRMMGQAGRYPPHRLSCDSGALLSEQLTEPAWMFDSDTALFGAVNGSNSTTPTPTFLGCFQPVQIPSIPLPTVCTPIGFNFSVCVDTSTPCAQNSEILKEGGLPAWAYAVAVAALFPPTPANITFAAILFSFAGEGCRVPEDRSNRGYSLDYWWPENQIEIHNYGRTVFDPTFECNNQEFQHGRLTDFLRTMSTYLTRFTPPGMPAGAVSTTGRGAGIPDGLRFDPHIGESHWAGIQPGDEVFTGEAHVYRTYLNTLTALNNPGDSTWLGYKRDCRCFYSSLDSQIVRDVRNSRDLSRKVVSGWTEHQKHLPFWRYYQNSQLLNRARYEAISQYSSFYRDSCAFLRAHEASLGSISEGYRDIYQAIGISPPPTTAPRLRDQLLRICYKGGGDLFPVTGQLIGQFNPLPAGAYLARRALYLFGTDFDYRSNPDDPLNPPDRRVNKYSDANDKLQRIYPLKDRVFASTCFQGHQIPNYLREDRFNWPRELLEDAMSNGLAGPNDSPRFIYWNRRKAKMCPYLGQVIGLKSGDNFIACRALTSSCGLEDRGDAEDSDTAPLQGFGPGNVPLPMPDGIPFPFLPKYESSRYELDPIMRDDPAVTQTRELQRYTPGGQCDLRYADIRNPRFSQKLHRKLPEQFVNQFGNNTGGLKCRPEYPRCTGPSQMPN